MVFAPYIVHAAIDIAAEDIAAADIAENCAAASDAARTAALFAFSVSPRFPLLPRLPFLFMRLV